MSKTDSPIVNLEKARKKLQGVHRNLTEAGEWGCVAACIELKRVIEWTRTRIQGKREGDEDGVV